VELIVMILVAFPIGFFIKNRLAAYVVYIAVHSYVFTFQSTALIIEWAGGSDSAFGEFQKSSTSDTFSYGIVNLVIYAVGLGLVTLGYRLGSRRRARRTQAVQLEPAGS
jgi:fatty acid desaturase